MRLSVVHTTSLTYSSLIAEEVMECRLGPLVDADQRWERFELRSRPGGHIRSFVDGFGNMVYLVTVAPTHDFLELTTHSEVTTLLADPFALPAFVARPLTPAERYDYLSPSSLVPPDARLKTVAAPYRAAVESDQFDVVAHLRDWVHAELDFIAEATTVFTTVAEVLDSHAGVCQDFSHVLIGLCRAAGVPARYVSGYVVRGDERDTAAAASSHAWVEAYSPTHGWRGFDATNNVLASERHVKIAIGRDYTDVSPTRGTYRGRAEASIKVEVAVSEIVS